VHWQYSLPSNVQEHCRPTQVEAHVSRPSVHSDRHVGSGDPPVVALLEPLPLPPPEQAMGPPGIGTLAHEDPAPASKTGGGVPGPGLMHRW
jgi:hypothetical protein